MLEEELRKQLKSQQRKTLNIANTHLEHHHIISITSYLFPAVLYINASSGWDF